LDKTFDQIQQAIKDYAYSDQAAASDTTFPCGVPPHWSSDRKLAVCVDRVESIFDNLGFLARANEFGTPDVLYTLDTNTGKRTDLRNAKGKRIEGFFPVFLPDAASTAFACTSQ
jgi:hypothetical protein